MSHEAIASFTTNMMKYLQDTIDPETKTEPDLACDIKKAIREKPVSSCISGNSFSVLTKGISFGGIRLRLSDFHFRKTLLFRRVVTPVRHVLVA